MNIFTKIALLSILIPMAAIGQNKQQLRTIIEATNVTELQRIAAENTKKDSENLDKALRLALKFNWPLTYRDKWGNSLMLIGVDDLDLPIYKGTENLGAAITSRTNLVWPSNNNITPNLSGRGYTVRVWDGGTARATHREFQGRVTNVSGVGHSEHATHVTGTIIAAGITASAKGGAFEASSRNFDFGVDNSTVPSEASQGATVTNHSYGLRGGWSQEDNGQWLWHGPPDSLRDPRFGYYDNSARTWDNFHVNAPYLLTVKSAGNQRGDGPNPGTPHTIVATGATSTLTRPANGPYDCLMSVATAKNNLVVGAVNNVANYTGPNSVTMSSFSCWGPTDDGRIKPDIVAKGVNVNSTGNTSDQNYVTLSGTSMSAPSVTGSLLLLQEHYSNTHNRRLMWGSTLKALVLHTADEAGTTPGPDYRFGWGLINTSRAASLISQDSTFALIREGLLSNNQVIEFDVQARGTMPLTATLCWTDPGGTPIPGQVISNRRDPMLVNDLDLRVINNTTQAVNLPWVLNPDAPAAAATRGDNLVDNVEKIEIASPGTGTYKIRISHKGNLTGTNQRYSLIVDGIIAGDTSIRCKGRAFYNSTTGIFDDGSGRNRNYMNNANCFWEIGDGDATNSVAIQFTRMNLQANDTVYVYNGKTTNAPLLGKFSGITIPPRVVADSGVALVHFISDGANNALGWEISYNILRRPTASIVVNDTSICRGSNVSLQATTTELSDAGWIYTWSLPGGTPETITGKTGTVTYTAVGTYSVTLTVTNEAGSVVINRPDLIRVNPTVGNMRNTYFESFESAASPFYTNSPDSAFVAPGVNDVFAWRKVSFAGKSGFSSMRIRNNPPSPRVRNLFTPTFNMTTFSTPRLVWWRAYARGSATSTDGLRIFISRNCGRTWISLRNYNNNQLSTIGTGASDIIPGNNFLPSPDNWVKDSVSLAPYAADSVVMFRFEMTSDRGNNLYLDDIRVGDGVITTASLRNSLSDLAMEIIPNPASTLEGFIEVETVKGGIAEIAVLDVAGRVLKSRQKLWTLHAGGNSIPLNLVFERMPARGVYFIKLKHNNQTLTQKVIIQ
jgi:hypothetical protein